MKAEYMAPWAGLGICILLGVLLALAFYAVDLLLDELQGRENDIEHEPAFYAVWGGERHPVWIVVHEDETYLLTEDLEGQCLTCQTSGGSVVQLSP